ncbi:zinc-binding dehydrogenase [Umezawaea endophytica]|uniref:Zinc-binding dehydrogenase n=1 Tax=Umezawaea endophytica TaxID=1654476 RepID=A0A9X2VWB2_9PSEU|nr:zinc-binding dehydrogenase [Umezawaea endophytica]MCS7482888.1 zinc-binding dehydrogenase [Umezawaea endophytica]
MHDLANAVRALKCADLRDGAAVVVTAATGAMGTATVALAARFGVSRLVLVGRDANRLAAVRELAGDLPTDTVATDDLPPDWAATGGLTAVLRGLLPRGADAVLDYAPEGVLGTQALHSMATGATFVHMGGNFTGELVPMAVMMVRCWRLVGTRANTRADVRDVLRLVGDGTVDADRLITHRYPLEDIGSALARMQARTEPIWMAVVTPPQADSAR